MYEKLVIFIETFKTFTKDYIFGTETGILFTVNLSIFLIYRLIRRIVLKLYQKLKERSQK